MMTYLTKEKNMAKAITPKEAANLLTRKRGRPVGSTKKQRNIKAELLAEVERNPSIVNSFAETLKAWDEMEAQVNWEEIAKKQETELKVLRDENDELARICVNRFEKINDYMKLVKYLEGRIEDLTIRSR